MIEVNNIIVRYRGQELADAALSSVSLQIGDGDYVAILGPNGSGKSTLLRALCGLVKLDFGFIKIFGANVRFGCFGEDFIGRVGVVFQEPQGQFIMRDVETEIGALLQNLGLPLGLQSQRFDEIVSQFELEDILKYKPENLSGGQMQIVNLACALAAKPKIVLLDEPTTFLDSHFKAMLLQYLETLNGGGITVVHITQYPDEALFAKRVCILDAGKIVVDGLAAESLIDDSLMKAHKFNSPHRVQFQKVFGFDWDDTGSLESFCQSLTPTADSTASDTVLEKRPAIAVKELEFEYRGGTFGMHIQELSLYDNEIVGLVGPAGCGKSTLAFLLAGLLKPDSGHILLSGKPIDSYSAKELRTYIGITWQLPDLTMIGPTVAEDIEFGLENLANQDVDIESLLMQVGLDGFEHRIVDTLSGGEKRKLALAGILASKPRYLVLDEPEAFLDPYSQTELAGIIRSIAGKGRGILVAAHDLYFLSEVADRIIGMIKGKIEFDIPSDKFFSDSQYLHRLGLPANTMIIFREKLAHQGIRIPFGSLSQSRIRNYLEKLK